MKLFRLNMHVVGAVFAASMLLTILATTSLAQNKGARITLFDGKDTSAWRGYKQEAFPAKGWIVSDGILSTDPKVASADRVDIMTREKFKDFDLELEWRISPGGNSGVFFGAAETDGPVWHTAPEMQILDDDRHPDANRGVGGNRRAGTLYDLLPANANKRLKPVGEFNKARITVRNNQVTHYLNGKKILEYTLGSPEMNRILAASKFKDLPRFAREPEGHIALQHHGEEVSFRNIRIKRL